MAAVLMPFQFRMGEDRVPVTFSKASWRVWSSSHICCLRSFSAALRSAGVFQKVSRERNSKACFPNSRLIVAATAFRMR